jgi:hypothetical protein
MQDSLHSLLHEWEVTLAPDPNFRAAVWGRIAAHKQRLSFRIWRRTDELVGQPGWATALVAGLLLVGSLSGNAWHAHRLQDERVAGLTAYVLAVDPIAHAATVHR